MPAKRPSLLAIVGFSLSLLGTFIVRSGVLTSVHAFATDPERGLRWGALEALSIERRGDEVVVGNTVGTGADHEVWVGPGYGAYGFAIDGAGAGFEGGNHAADGFVE